MNGTTSDYYELATQEFDRRVQAVADDRWDGSTPCTEWNVRTLVNHLVYETRWLPPLMEGRTIAEVGDRFDGDLLGDDPKGAWTEASRTAVEAVKDGSLDGTVHLSFGDTTGEDYVWQVISDLTVHSWDLARGAGADEAIDARLVDEVLRRAEPQAEMLARSGVFGTPVEVGPDADPQTRLLGLVGRRAT